MDPYPYESANIWIVGKKGKVYRQKKGWERGGKVRWQKKKRREGWVAEEEERERVDGRKDRRKEDGRGRNRGVLEWNGQSKMDGRKVR